VFRAKEAAMYLPKYFEITDDVVIDGFVRRNSFATLVTTGDDDAPFVSHIPLVLHRDAKGRELRGHVARPNPHWPLLEKGRPTLAIFQGPHAYVSPSWYTQHPAVPTWNYGTVHMSGPTSLLDETELLAFLDELIATFEPPEMPYQAPEDFKQQMARGVVGFRLAVTRVEAKFKMSQNRGVEDQKAVIQTFEAREEQELAALMRQTLGLPA
jgi:transcriptional regulator